MSYHVFVDETKQRRYVMVACAVATADLDATRIAINRITLPGQRRLHMTKEHAARRRLILSTVSRCFVRATVYVADPGAGDRDARAECLRAIVEDIADGGGRRVVLDRDETLVKADNRTLIEATRTFGYRDNLRYEHCPGHSEPLLALPDAVAWAWVKGADWRRRVRTVVDRVRPV